MGCSGTKIAPEVVEDPRVSQELRSNDQNGVISNGNAVNIGENGWTEPATGESGVTANGTLSEKEKENRNEILAGDDAHAEAVCEPQAPWTSRDKTIDVRKPKGVAFNVLLAGNESADILLKASETRRPRKLQKIKSAPELTAEMLAHKLAAAEENRQKELEKRAKKTSKRRKELLIAREMDKAQQQMAEFEEKMTTRDKNRAKAQAEIIAKQKKHEDHAKKVRDKARKIREGDDVVHVAVDPDETYNADEDDDTWEDDAASSKPSTADQNSQVTDATIEDTVPEQHLKPKEDINMNSVHDFFNS